VGEQEGAAFGVHADERGSEEGIASESIESGSFGMHIDASPEIPGSCARFEERHEGMAGCGLKRVTAVVVVMDQGLIMKMMMVMVEVSSFHVSSCTIPTIIQIWRRRMMKMMMLLLLMMMSSVSPSCHSHTVHFWKNPATFL
jgi:hypothetical protein